MLGREERMVVQEVANENEYDRAFRHWRLVVSALKVKIDGKLSAIDKWYISVDDAISSFERCSALLEGLTRSV